MWFRYFVIYSPWERAGHSVNKFIGCICAKFWWNWSSCFGEEDIIKFPQCIFVIFYFLPFEKSGTVRLNRHQYPSPKDDLSQIWLKLATCLRRRRIKFRQWIFANLLLSPLATGHCPSFENLDFTISSIYFR